MKKWILIIIMVLVAANTSAFFISSEGGTDSGGLWAAIRGYFTSEACFPHWVSSAGACLINNTRLKTYTDSNSCGVITGMPSDNGTYYSTCDYCSYDLSYAYTSLCAYDNETQNFFINGTVYDSNWASCCQATGLASDCYSSDTQSYNYTYSGPFACEEPDKMWYVAIAIILVGIFGIFFFIATNWNFTLFSRTDKDIENKSNAIKVFLVWLGFWMVIPLIQLMIEIAQENSAGQDIITLLTRLYTADMMINYVISAYFIIYFVYNILLYFGIDIVEQMRK